jgi:uncharacterized membrane protein YfcA
MATTSHPPHKDTHNAEEDPVKVYPYRDFPTEEEENEETLQEDGGIPQMVELPSPKQQQQQDDINSTMPLAARWLQKYADVLMMPILPLAWCGLLLGTMDRKMILSAYAMPLLGIASASLANSVPVGGGIIFVPVLSLVLGDYDLKLGPAFAVATMTFGNGVFGFLSWLQKDPKSIAWHIVPYAVIPAWIGASWAIFYPFLSGNACRRLFAMFCLKVALVVGRGIYVGDKYSSSDDDAALYNYGRSTKAPDVAHDNTFSILEDTMYDRDDTVKFNTTTSTSPPEARQIVWASGASFLAGSILVSHIGIGNAMTTFLVACFVWRLPAKSAVVTGILCGGWTSLVPFLWHLLVLRDVPIALWVMGLPGVYLGARIAPLVHDHVGIFNVLRAFCIFLLVTFLLMVSS